MIWDHAPPHQRAQVYGTILAGVLFLVHYVAYSGWYIEDAAISFAYARHFAEGHGFVPYHGGEPVEGFSNPTWTLLLAGLHGIGLDPWVGAKLAGAVFGLAGLPFAAWWSASILGGRRDALPALTPLWLAVSPQYVTWAASGLENSIVTLLMAAGGALLLREVQRPSVFPWSGLLFSLLAISRPEAPAYAALAAVVGLVSVALAQGPGAAVGWAWRWALLAAGPFALWNTWRFLHFAWEAPNTYYAKLHDGDRFRPWDWSGKRAKGWNYVRAWSLQHAQGFLVPLYVYSQAGTSPWRRPLSVLVGAIWLLILIPGLGWTHNLWGDAPLAGVFSEQLGKDGLLPAWPFAPDAPWSMQLRVLTCLFLGIAAPLLGIGRPGQAGRWLSTWFITFALFFAVYAGGDWMEGYRWMNLAIVPLATLFTDLIAGLWDGLRRLAPLPRALIAGIPVVVTSVLAVVWTVDHIGTPETSPYDVGRRVTYMHRFGERLGLEHATWMDVDMGAHMWWAGERDEIVDMAGLIDMPMGHHKWERPFVAEYVFEERNPDFAHVHASWATKTRMRSHDSWRKYLEISPYPISPRKVHVGNHVRRDLLFVPTGTGSPDGSRSVKYDAPFSLAGWNTPSTAIVPGNPLWVYVYLHRTGNAGSARPVMFLAGAGRTIAVDVPPAYDEVPLLAWNRDEEARVLVRLPIPADLPIGLYDLGFVWIGSDRSYAPLNREPALSPALHRDEVRWEGVVEVISTTEADKRFADALRPGQPCEAVEASWSAARRMVAEDHPSRASRESAARGRLALCQIGRLEAGWARDASPGELATYGRLAARWGRDDPSVLDQLRTYAARFRARSADLERQRDLDGAWRWSTASLALDPSQTWERRRAERLRDKRLGIEGTPGLSESLRVWLGW